MQSIVYHQFRKELNIIKAERFVYHPQLVEVYHQHEVLHLIKPQEKYTLTRDEIQPQKG